MRNIMNVKKVFNNSRNNNNKDGLRLDSRRDKKSDMMMNIDTKRTGATMMSG